MTTYRYLQLDVFTDRAFGGNALAVYPEAEGLSTEEMLKISREMNLSETVFVLKPEKTPAVDSRRGRGENQRRNRQRKNQTGEDRKKSCGACAFSHRRVKSLLRVIRSLALGTRSRAKASCQSPRGTVGHEFIRNSASAFCLSISNSRTAQPVQVVMTQGKFEISREIDDGHEQAEIARALGLPRRARRVAADSDDLDRPRVPCGSHSRVR